VSFFKRLLGIVDSNRGQTSTLVLRRAIIVTSNRAVQDWGRYLGDATMATTILDRLMQRCAMLEFEGKSYWLKEAAARIVTSLEAS
jgi:DNA replication protein DnaC